MLPPTTGVHSPACSTCPMPGASACLATLCAGLAHQQPSSHPEAASCHPAAGERAGEKRGACAITWAIAPPWPGSQLLAAGAVPRHVPMGTLLLARSDAGCCPNLQRLCGRAASGAGRALMRVGLQPWEARFGLVRASQHPGWQRGGERGGWGQRRWEWAVLCHALPRARAGSGRRGCLTPNVVQSCSMA